MCRHTPEHTQQAEEIVPYSKKKKRKVLTTHQISDLSILTNRNPFKIAMNATFGHRKSPSKNPRTIFPVKNFEKPKNKQPEESSAKAS